MDRENRLQGSLLFFSFLRRNHAAGNEDTPQLPDAVYP